MLGTGQRVVILGFPMCRSANHSALNVILLNHTANPVILAVTAFALNLATGEACFAVLEPGHVMTGFRALMTGQGLTGPNSVWHGQARPGRAV